MMNMCSKLCQKRLHFLTKSSYTKKSKYRKSCYNSSINKRNGCLASPKVSRADDMIASAFSLSAPNGKKLRQK